MESRTSAIESAPPQSLPDEVVQRARLQRMLEEIAKHGNTRRALRELNESNYWFYSLMESDELAAEQYARAKRIGVQGMADETLEIADDGSNDTYTDENGNDRVNTEVVARSRLRVDTRKWLLSKIMPKVYGDKLDIEHGGNVTLNLTPQDVSVL
jgi:hypothetical protein